MGLTCWDGVGWLGRVCWIKEMGDKDVGEGTVFGGWLFWRGRGRGWEKVGLT